MLVLYIFIHPRIRIFNANPTVLLSSQLSKYWRYYSTNTKNKPCCSKIFHISLILYIFITTGFAFLIWFQRSYSRCNWIKTDDAIPWITKINQIHQYFRIWNVSQKGNDIQYALLPSIPSRPPMPAERVGQLIIIIVGRKYVFPPLETHAKCVQQLVGIPSINSGDVYICLHCQGCWGHHRQGF